jgi:hypothetical protein
MKSILTNLLLPVTALLLFASCKSYHYMYAPVATSTPMFNKKGESDVSALYSFGSIFRTNVHTHNDGYDLQGAYAVSDHFALTAAFSHRHERNVYDSTNTFGNTVNSSLSYRRNTTLLGVGYFTPCNASGSSFFDLYAGYGIGRYQLDDDGVAPGPLYHQFHDCNVNNYYVQPGFHFNGRGAMQVSLATRINTISYYNIATDYTAAQEKSYNMAVIRNTVFSFLEPSFTIRGWAPGAPWIRIEFQASTSIKLNNTALYYRESYLSLGLSFDLSRLDDHGGKNVHGPSPHRQL